MSDWENLLRGDDLTSLYELGTTEFLKSKGFVPGGEAYIDGVRWTAEELAANPDVDWGRCHE